MYFPNTRTMATLTAKDSSTLCFGKYVCLKKKEMEVYMQMNEIKLAFPCEKAN